MVGAFGPVRHRVDRSGGDVGVTEKPAIAVTVSCQERQPAATAELEYLGHFGDVVLARGERRRQVFPVDQVVRPDAGDAVRVHQFAAVTEAGGVEADPSAARIAHDAQVARVLEGEGVVQAGVPAGVRHDDWVVRISRPVVAVVAERQRHRLLVHGCRSHAVVQVSAPLVPDRATGEKMVVVVGIILVRAQDLSAVFPVDQVAADAVADPAFVVRFGVHARPARCEVIAVDEVAHRHVPRIPQKVAFGRVVHLRSRVAFVITVLSGRRARELRLAHGVTTFGFALWFRTRLGRSRTAG